jgi:hypothetical protein
MALEPKQLQQKHWFCCVVQEDEASLAAGQNGTAPRNAR